jgi:hypothetical protein
MYNTNKLNSVSDCDALLNKAASEQAILGFRKTSIEFRAKSYADNATEIETELQEVQAGLAAMPAIIAALPEGDEKKKQIFEQDRLTFREVSLNFRKRNVSMVDVLSNELEVVKLQKELEAVAALITEVEARKAQL